MEWPLPTPLDTNKEYFELVRRKFDDLFPGDPQGDTDNAFLLLDEDLRRRRLQDNIEGCFSNRHHTFLQEMFDGLLAPPDGSTH